MICSIDSCVSPLIGSKRVMPVDFVAKEFDPHGVLGVGGAKLDGIAADAEFTARELEIVALVLHFDEAREEVFAGEKLALGTGQTMSL